MEFTLNYNENSKVKLCAVCDQFLGVSIYFCEVHHDHGNSYTREHLLGASLKLQRFNPLCSWQETWQYPDNHDAGGGKSCASGSTDSRKVNWLLRHQTPISSHHTPTQSHTHFKATPHNSYIPYGPILHTQGQEAIPIQTTATSDIN